MKLARRGRQTSSTLDDRWSSARRRRRCWEEDARFLVSCAAAPCCRRRRPCPRRLLARPWVILLPGKLSDGEGEDVISLLARALIWLALVCSFFSTSAAPSESAGGSSGVKKTPLGRRVVHVVLLSLTGGFALSALNDLAIFHGCSRYYTLCTQHFVRISSLSLPTSDRSMRLCVYISFYLSAGNPLTLSSLLGRDFLNVRDYKTSRIYFRNRLKKD